jgi:sn-glycerol 3-phosphate transport system ATP-binding protein
MYARPASTFAARFIGTPAMNLVQLESGCIAGSRWRVGGDGAPCMGLRPEAIAVAHGGASLSGAREPGAIELPAQVVGQEYLGADLVLRCQVGSEVLTVRAPGPQQVAPGAPVLLRWYPRDTHFFAADGQRVASAAVSPQVLVAMRAAA